MKKRMLSFVVLILLLLLASIFVFPLCWMVLGSFDSATGAGASPGFWPKKVTLKNYFDLSNEFPIARWTINSLLVAFSVVAISVSTSCLAGYAFAKKSFFGKDVLFWLLMSTLMVPFYSIMIPLFVTMRDFSLFNTYPGIFLPMSCGAANIFLARQYISILPSELIDAAKIDGASELRVFLLVILPLCKPLVAVLTIFTFVYGWKAFLWPLIITSSKEMRTLSVAVVTCVSYPDGFIEFGMAMAGATLVVLPTFVVFAFFQKYFVRGITMGGIKG